MSRSARQVNIRAGGVIVTAGDVLEALVVVDDGELALGERGIVKAKSSTSSPASAPSLVAHDLRALRASRVIRLERVEFELVDDVPGLAASVCRTLGERARKAEDAAYPHSPLQPARSMDCDDVSLLLARGRARTPGDRRRRSPRRVLVRRDPADRLPLRRHSATCNASASAGHADSRSATSRKQRRAVSTRIV
ncbi:MAG: hypothetical protein WKG01_34345 [Kofleriaceae bacterium]